MALEGKSSRFTVDIFIPEALRAEPETLRKARLSLHIAALLVVLSQASAASYALRGHAMLAAIAFVSSLLLLLTPLFLRAREPLQYAGTYLGLVPLSGACGLAYYTGGLYSAGLWWMTAVPVLSLLVAGRRAALQIAGCGLLAVSALCYLHASAHAWPELYDARAVHGVTALKIWQYLGADDARFAELEYSPVFAGTEIACLVLVVTDVTLVVESERGAAAQAELAEVLDRAVRDRRGVLASLRETDELIADLVPNGAGQGPLLHTIKGTCAFFGARMTASATSGRGFGMAALKAAVLELRGNIELSSESGSAITNCTCLPAVCADMAVFACFCRA